MISSIALSETFSLKLSIPCQEMCCQGPNYREILNATFSDYKVVFGTQLRSGLKPVTFLKQTLSTFREKNQSIFSKSFLQQSNLWTVAKFGNIYGGWHLLKSLHSAEV